MANGPVTAVDEVRRLVEAAWADRARLADPAHREAVLAAVAGLDRGELRVAEKVDGEWTVNAWLMQAVNLYFAVTTMETQDYGPFQVRDKIPLKKDLEAAGIRIVPGGIVRYGAYVAPGAVVLPGFVNIGARVGKGTMVDTWATVGSCAQVGRQRAPGRRRGNRRRARAARSPPQHHRGRLLHRQPLHPGRGGAGRGGIGAGRQRGHHRLHAHHRRHRPGRGRAEEAGPGPLGGHPRDAPRRGTRPAPTRSPAPSSWGGAARPPTRRCRSTTRCGSSRSRRDHRRSARRSPRAPRRSAPCPRPSARSGCSATTWRAGRGGASPTCAGWRIHSS